VTMSTGSKALEDVVQRQVASDHVCVVLLFRPGRSGGDKPDFKAIRGREHKRCTIHTWLTSRHSCRKIRMFRMLLKFLSRSRYEKQTEDAFCTNSKRWSKNLCSRLRLKFSLIWFEEVQVHLEQKKATTLYTRSNERTMGERKDWQGKGVYWANEPAHKPIY